MVSFDIQSFVVSICIVLRYPEHAPVAGKTWHLLPPLLHIVVTFFDFAQCCLVFVILTRPYSVFQVLATTIYIVIHCQEALVYKNVHQEKKISNKITCKSQLSLHTNYSHPHHNVKPSDDCLYICSPETNLFIRNKKRPTTFP